jgi:hypothetical protein
MRRDEITKKLDEIEEMGYEEERSFDLTKEILNDLGIIFLEDRFDLKYRDLGEPLYNFIFNHNGIGMTGNIATIFVYKGNNFVILASRSIDLNDPLIKRLIEVWCDIDPDDIHQDSDDESKD